MIIIPSENFHAARVSDPSNYKKIVSTDLGDGITLLSGVTDEKDESKTEPQSYHFSADKWKAKDVKKWLKDHDVKPIELSMATKPKDEIEARAGTPGIATEKAAIRQNPLGTWIIGEGGKQHAGGSQQEVILGRKQRYRIVSEAESDGKSFQKIKVETILNETQ